MKYVLTLESFAANHSIVETRATGNKQMANVSVALTVTATMNFQVEDDVEVTREMIEARVSAAQHAIDKRGDDENGIYILIDSFAEPILED